MTEETDDRRGAPISTTEWIEMCALYESGDWTQEEIAKKFNRNAPNLSLRFKKHGIVKGAAAQKRKELIDKQLEKDAVNNSKLVVNRANETKNEHYIFARSISLILMRKIEEATKNGQNLGRLQQELTALRTAAQTLDVVQTQRNKALGLDKGDVVDETALPQLEVIEMSLEERKRIEYEQSIKYIQEQDENEDFGLSGIFESQPDSEEDLDRNIKLLRQKLLDEDELKNERIPGHDG